MTNPKYFKGKHGGSKDVWNAVEHREFNKMKYIYLISWNTFSLSALQQNGRFTEDDKRGARLIFPSTIQREVSKCGNRYAFLETER